jgi:hypothetical protein
MKTVNHGTGKITKRRTNNMTKQTLIQKATEELRETFAGWSEEELHELIKEESQRHQKNPAQKNPAQKNPAAATSEKKRSASKAEVEEALTKVRQAYKKLASKEARKKTNHACRKLEDQIYCLEEALAGRYPLKELEMPTIYLRPPHEQLVVNWLNDADNNSKPDGTNTYYQT